MNILLTPARIGEVEIHNRIVLPPMTTRTADAEGFVTDVTFESSVPAAMTKARIEQTKAAFAEAARRAQRAGFDCVEIHAAHGYLISQFHNVFENRRSDEYGGTLENRARFGLEILRSVKAAVGGMPVVYRISVEDFFPDGMHFAEGKRMAIWAAEPGAGAR